MKLLTVPPTSEFITKKEYTKFKDFQLAFTRRNWVGNQYCVEEDCFWFFNELKELENKITLIPTNTYVDFFFCSFLLDTSVFSNLAPLNIKIVEFLEELGEIDFSDSNLLENHKAIKKYEKKLRYFAQQLENTPHLLRWAHLNNSHPFSADIIQNVHNKLSESSNKVYRDFMNSAKKSKNLPTMALKQSEYERAEKKRIVEDSSNLEKIFRYTLNEPSLFYFAVYAFKHYLSYNKIFTENIDDGADGISCILYFQRPNKVVEAYFVPSTPELSESLIGSDMFITHQIGYIVNQTLRDQEVGLPYSLHSLPPVENEDFYRDNIDLLKTLVKWVSERIPEGKWNCLPKGNWIHFIENDYFLENDIEAIHFESTRLVKGPTEMELLLHGLVVIDKMAISFPVLDTTCWENLTPTQCAIMAYAACLFHDICIENNHQLIPMGLFLDEFNVPEEFHGFDYVLRTEFTEFEKKSKRIGTTNRKEKEIEKIKKVTKKEHWVNFHFRRLTLGQNPSQKAKENALLYGFKELPDGFTFVDSFIRGEHAVEISDMRISALDVLNKTLSRISKRAMIVEIQKQESCTDIS